MQTDPNPVTLPFRNGRWESCTWPSWTLPTARRATSTRTTALLWHSSLDQSAIINATWAMPSSCCSTSSAPRAATYHQQIAMSRSRVAQGPRVYDLSNRCLFQEAPKVLRLVGFCLPIGTRSIPPTPRPPCLHFISPSYDARPPESTLQIHMPGRGARLAVALRPRGG